MQHLDQQDTAALVLLGALALLEIRDGQLQPKRRWVKAGELAAHETALRWADSRAWITRRQHQDSGQWRLALTQLGLRELSVFMRRTQ